MGSVLFSLYKENNKDICKLEIGTKLNADRILHLAAKSPPASADEIIESNVYYLKRVIDYAVTNGIKEIVFFSAVSVYGDFDRENLNENVAYGQPGLYGISKLLGEELLRNSPLKALSLRLPAILSPRNRTNFISRCYLKLKENQDLEIANPDRLFNNFISIENIFSFLQRLKLSEKFDAINLASKKEMTLREVVRFIKDALGSESKIVILDKKRNFFNISTHKAESRYGFIPYSAKDALTGWAKQVRAGLKEGVNH